MTEPKTAPKVSAEFAGLTFRGLRTADLLADDGVLKFVVTVNADLVVIASRNARFKQLISQNYATFDGQVTWWLARLLAKPRGLAIEKISGSSFAYQLLEHAAKHGLRVFLLGATSAVNAAAVQTASSRYCVNVAGYSPPFTVNPCCTQWNTEILARVRAHRPHIVLVAFGSPKQEFWIEDHRDELESAGVQLVIGCGGTLDFLSGALRRAPITIQRLGLEGVYRLAMQPTWFRLRRLGRSIMVIPIALWKAFH